MLDGVFVSPLLFCNRCLGIICFFHCQGPP
jgi:hypothetical protein